MDYQDYAAIPAVNWSTLKHMRQSPAHYRAALHAPPTPDTDALILGRVTHMALWEPDRLLTDVVVWEGATRRGKAWDAFQAEHAGKDIIRPRDLESIRCMADAVRSHPVSGPILAKSGKGEQTLTWTDARTSLPCKARIDWLTDDGDLVDLKTTADLDPRAFAAAVHRYGYHGQLAHYRSGCIANGHKMNRVLVIAVEKTEPYDVVVYQLEDGPGGALFAGRQLRDQLLDQLSACIDADTWPGRAPDAVEPLELPHYALSDRRAQARLREDVRNG